MVRQVPNQKKKVSMKIISRRIKKTWFCGEWSTPSEHNAVNKASSKIGPKLVSFSLKTLLFPDNKLVVGSSEASSISAPRCNAVKSGSVCNWISSKF